MDEPKTAAALMIDGHEYPLAYDFNSLCNAEMLTGCNLLVALRDLANLSAGQLIGVLYAAITAGDPSSKLKVRDVGALIRLDTLGSIQEALAHAYLNSLPNKEPVL